MEILAKNRTSTSVNKRRGQDFTKANTCCN